MHVAQEPLLRLVGFHPSTERQSVRSEGSAQDAGASTDFSEVAARQELTDLVTGKQRRRRLRKSIRQEVSLYLLREQLARNFKRPQHRTSRGEEAKKCAERFVDKPGTVLVDELALESFQSVPVHPSRGRGRCNPETSWSWC